jgi:hypothetical protein
MMGLEAVAAIALFCAGAAIGVIMNQIHTRRASSQGISPNAGLVISQLPDEFGLLPDACEPTSQAWLDIHLD